MTGWSPEALAASLHLAVLLGLVQAANDNGHPARPAKEGGRRGSSR